MLIIWVRITPVTLYANTAKLSMLKTKYIHVMNVFHIHNHFIPAIYWQIMIKIDYGLLIQHLDQLNDRATLIEIWIKLSLNVCPFFWYMYLVTHGFVYFKLILFKRNELDGLKCHKMSKDGLRWLLTLASWMFS